MSNNQSPIDIEPAPQTQALQRVESGAVGRALSVSELHERLEYVREVMRKEMREGTDYGKIPGAGDRPTLLQPGAQKLLMTFNLTESVKKEVLREYQNFHREYEFTITVQAPNGKEWDGVGTCSTLESKYRWRKAERVCPTCGKHTIIQGKEQYGGGWLCWKKKGGCGATFQFSDQRIAGQEVGRTENPDVPDQWNTVRKMGFKRALVAAAINATNTSELWTQDMEDTGAGSDDLDLGKGGPPPPPPPKATKPSPPTKPAVAPSKPPIFATADTRARMIEALQDEIDLATEYFRKLSGPAVLLPNEELSDLPLQFVPTTQRQMDLLKAAISDFGNGMEAKHAYAPNPTVPAAKPTKAAQAEKPIEVPRDPPEPPPAQQDSGEWWRNIIVPIPHKGQTHAEYLKHPETIGQLYDMRHGNDEESQAARQRLWGFLNHYEPKPWTKRDGSTVPASAADIKFREALDACLEYHEKNHPDEEGLRDE